MFYQGDLQSGIASAVRAAKPVVCFVRDDQEESTTWEDDYFDNEELRGLLSNDAVTLRLIAGTQEAGFLTSICPIQSFPTVIVIRNGVLQEYLVAGTSKDAFQTRLKTVIAAPSNSNTAPVAPSPPAQQEISQANSQTTATTDISMSHTQAPVAPTTSQLQTPNNSSTSRSVSGQSPAAALYQTQQATNESTERTNRESIRDGKRPEKQVAPEEKKALQEKEDRRAMQLKIQREQKEQKEERERIKNQIKQDQEARRQRAAEEKGTSFSTSNAAVGNSKPGRKQASQFRLQIRLFDGSSVRNSFPPSATIRKDIRPWLDSQRSDGSQPYNLKHILTPLPNRTIAVTEEERSLEELELGPTASLVMVPIPTYIEAYAPTGVLNSLPGRVISSGYGMVSGVVGGVTGMVGGFLGYGGSSAAPDSTNDESTGPATASSTRTGNGSKINIRTLHDQWNDQDKNEFYNGNTLNFEPRRDDDSKKK